MQMQDFSSDLLTSNQSQQSTIITIKKSWHKWLALSFSCLLLVGSFLCYDFPQNLDTQIQQENGGLGVSETDVNLFYSVYSFPNILLPFISGFLIDVIGVRKCLFLFSLLLIIGQGICTIGVYHSLKSYYTVLAGRCIFGLGGEALAIAQSTIITKWFNDKDLSFAFGITTSVSSIGSILGSFIFPATYDISNDLFLPLLVGTLICIFSWCCGICLNLMDIYADKQEGKGTVIIGQQDKLKVEDIKNLNGIYWWLCISCAVTYTCFYPFMQTLQNYLILQFGLSESSASNYLSIPYIISIGITPLAGVYIDKFGKRAIILVGTSFLLFGSHILMIIIPQCRNENDIQCVSYWFILPLILIGLQFSIFTAVLYPCVPLVCEPKIVATAFGITYCLQNLGLALFPIATGEIIQDTTKDNGFFWDQILLASVSLVTVGINLKIYQIDMKTGCRLNSPLQKQRDEEELLKESNSENIQAIF